MAYTIAPPSFPQILLAYKRGEDVSLEDRCRHNSQVVVIRAVCAAVATGALEALVGAGAPDQGKLQQQQQQDDNTDNQRLRCHFHILIGICMRRGILYAHTIRYNSHIGINGWIQKGALAPLPR